MESQELKACLRHEVEAWAAKSCDTVRGELRDVVVYEGAFGGTTYQVEVQLLEDLPEYVHVGVAVGDETLRRTIFPLCSSILVHADGRVDRES